MPVAGRLTARNRRVVRRWMGALAPRDFCAACAGTGKRGGAHPQRRGAVSSAQQRCATGRPRLHGPAAVRPEALRQDQCQPWQTVRVDAAGRDLEMKIKTMGAWRSRMTGPADGHWIGMAPLGYRLRAGGKLLYRHAAWLWVADPGVSLLEAVQGYVRRWEGKVNLRDEKTLLGVGQAQVRHPQSVVRVPARQVTAYSALLWCAQKQDQPAQFLCLPRPKWRGKSPPVRVSTASLINLLRYDAWAGAFRPETFRGFWDNPGPDQ